MKFAINYSPQAARLLDEGQIAVDRFKCPPWPDLVAEAKTFSPVCIHFGLRADPDLNSAIDVDMINTFRTDTHTPYVNLHLVPGQERFPDMPLDTTDAADVAAVTDTMLAGVARAVDLFGAENVILENVPYFATRGQAMRPAVEPAIIRRVVEETGCGFLLDISHARLSARHMGQDEYAYLAQLPGEMMREMHVTGIGHNLDGDICDHMGLAQADWPALDWVLERIRAGVWAAPWLLAFEYGGIGPLFDWRSDPTVIAGQVPALAERVRTLG